MLKRILLTFLALSFLSPAFAAIEFDNHYLKIKVVPDERAKEFTQKAFKTRLNFDDNRLTDEEGMRRGFGSTEFETSESSGGKSFAATQTSEKEGTRIWSGTRVGKKVDGTLIWRQADGRTFTFTYKGIIKRQKN